MGYLHVKLENEFYIGKSPLIIRHKRTNTAFYFYCVDDPMKIKSAKIAKGYVMDSKNWEVQRKRLRLLAMDVQRRGHRAWRHGLQYESFLLDWWNAERWWSVVDWHCYLEWLPNVSNHIAVETTKQYKAGQDKSKQQ